MKKFCALSLTLYVIPTQQKVQNSFATELLRGACSPCLWPHMAYCGNYSAGLALALILPRIKLQYAMLCFRNPVIVHFCASIRCVHRYGTMYASESGCKLRSLWERMPHSSYTSAAEDIVRNEGPPRPLQVSILISFLFGLRPLLSMTRHINLYTRT